MKKAMFWKKKRNTTNNTVQCLLCAHNCKISDGKSGVCKVRINKNGTLYTKVYGLASPGVVDPIEKKPLYHFFPGSKVYSFGTVSCNFKCANCQNWNISQISPKNVRISPIPPKKAVGLAKEINCKGVAWTYNEPTVWYEYTYFGSKVAKRNGLYSVYVSNGYINPEPLKKIAPYLDAFNIDIKSFDDAFYRKICKSKLAPVLRTAELVKKMNKHIEITNLLIPTLNDDPNNIHQLVSWVHDKLGDETPIHFSRFHPDNKLKHLSRTPEETLVKAYKIAKDVGMKYVFLGNLYHPRYGNTYCPNCDHLIIRRSSTFNVRSINLINGHCPECNKKILNYF